MTVMDTRHPSQIDHGVEIPTVAAVAGLAFTSLIAVCVLVASRILVRRIYFNTDTKRFRLVISNIARDKHVTVSPKAINTRNHLCFNYMLGKKRLFINEDAFVTGPYYDMLVAS